MKETLQTTSMILALLLGSWLVVAVFSSGIKSHHEFCQKNPEDRTCREPEQYGLKSSFQDTIVSAEAVAPWKSNVDYIITTTNRTFSNQNPDQYAVAKANLGKTCTVDIFWQRGYPAEMDFLFIKDCK